MKTNSNILKAPITDLAFLKQLLPHREPMIMIDSLQYFDDDHAISTLRVSNQNLFVEHQHLSETGLIEHMAQTAALHIGYKFHIKNCAVREGFIGAIKKLKIDSLPIINTMITSEVTITYEIKNMTQVQIISKVNGIMIAEAEMNTVLK